MRKMQGVMIGALTAFLFCIGCGEGADPVNDDAVSGDDAMTDSDAAADLDTVMPDGDTVIPTKPGADFNTPALNAVFEFKGLINTYDDIIAKTDTKGVMDMTLALGDIDIVMNDYPTSYRLLYPDDEEQYGELAGTEHLLLGSFGDLRQEGSNVMYYTFIAGMPVTSLEEIKKNKTPEVTAEMLAARVNLYHTTYLKRADNSIVLRRCMIAVMDTPAESRFFIDFAGNTDFTPGENLLAWGNIALTVDFDPAKLSGYEQYEGQWCTFKLDDATITEAQYEEELVKDVSKLDCELPEGFLDGAGDMSAVYTFRGVINEPGGQNTAGFGTFTVKIGGEAVVVSDYIAVAGTTTGTEGQELVTVEAIGGVETISGQNYYRYNYFSAIVDKQTLLNAKTAGDASCLFSGIGDGEKAFVQLLNIEEKQVNSITYQKVCPTAVLAPLPATSAIFYCIGGNTEFAVGEEVQSAANVTLTTDEAYMMEVFGVDSADKLCGCNENYTTVIECAAYDAVQP